MPEATQAFLDAADDLLAAQQRLVPHPLSEELRALTEAYIAMRAALMDGAPPGQSCIGVPRLHAQGRLLSLPAAAPPPSVLG